MNKKKLKIQKNYEYMFVIYLRKKKDTDIYRYALNIQLTNTYITFLCFK